MICAEERLDNVNGDASDGDMCVSFVNYGDGDPCPHLTRLSLEGGVMYALRLVHSQIYNSL